MNDYRPAQYEHFFSPETALSLELPADAWTMLGGTVGSVAFVHVPDPEHSIAHPPRIDVRLVEIPGDPPDAYRHLAAELAKAGGNDGGESTDLTVDGHAGVRTVVTRHVDDVGDIFQQQTVAQVGHIVLTVVATVEQALADRFAADFERGVDSIRIIAGGDG